MDSFDTVRNWLRSHPGATAGEIAAATGLMPARVVGILMNETYFVPGARRPCKQTGIRCGTWTVKQ